MRKKNLYCCCVKISTCKKKCSFTMRKLICIKISMNKYLKNVFLWSCFSNILFIEFRIATNLKTGLSKKCSWKILFTEFKTTTKIILLGGVPTSICHFFHPSVCLSIRLSIHPSICHAAYLRNHASSDHNFWYTYVKWYLQGFFSFFQNFDFLGFFQQILYIKGEK